MNETGCGCLVGAFLGAIGLAIGLVDGNIAAGAITGALFAGVSFVVGNRLTAGRKAREAARAEQQRLAWIAQEEHRRLAWHAYGEQQRMQREYQLEQERQEQERKRQERWDRLCAAFGAETARRIETERFWQGATPEIVVASLGHPEDVKTSVLKTKTKETYCYEGSGGNRYGLRIHFENGVVVGWDQA